VRVSVATGDLTLNTLLQNQFAAMNISCLDISAASRIPDDLNTYFNTFDDDQARLWFLAGVKNVAVPEQGVAQLQQNPDIAANIAQANGYTLEPTGSPDLPSHALVEMKDYLAKTTSVPNAEFFLTDKALLKRLADPNWKPRETVLLNMGHKLHSFLPTTGGASAPSQIELKTYTPTEIEIQAQSTHGGFVLINDQYDPDWQVQVNGRDAEVLRADYIMRAVQIPPGDSTISLRYVAHYHVAGLNPTVRLVNIFSDGVMLAAWLIAGVALWRQNSPSRARESVAR